ncbi:sugar MFS transporter [Sphingomonas sp. H160509]|uniref:sugar MFS transporter n=1 Tax=Sphingomonas sp. H160509 TaxID=2955313 RepID=UPI0020972894|nr:sugar MFS transporter [Sphingomonas sp. H160509]MDD1451397.1 sugar MFS transporter [Sphingomonas sp. H160509]
MPSEIATASRSTDPNSTVPRSLVWLVIGLFFIWGGATSLNDILIPKLKGLFSLTYTEVMLTQFAFFMAYFIVSVPAGTLVARIGYVRGLVVGLAVMALGAVLFWPAAGSGTYWSFLIALFVLAGGITILQVAANPLIAGLGDPAGASSRLTFAQAFNSLGTTIAPYIGAQLILGSAAKVDPATISASALPAFRAAESEIVAHIYLGIAVVLAVIAVIFWTQRKTLRSERPDEVGFRDSLRLLRVPRVRFGVIALFAYVGAEVSIGSVLVNYLEQPSTLALSAQSAGERLSFYWGGAMVGRFIGSWLLNRIAPGRLLAVFAGIAAALVLTSIVSTGGVAGWTLIAVGLFNSIMFPTVFSLSLEGLGRKTAEGSGLLCMAIVGGAIVPLITGSIADASTIATALIVPVICYGLIVAFGLSASRKVAQ